MSEIYTYYLAISRIVLPVLALLCVLLWIRLFRRSDTRLHSLCELAADDENYISVYDSENIIGRSRVCDIQLPVASISKKHALLYENGEEWFIAPLGGDVTINGEEISEPASLGEGDIIGFSDQELKFRSAPIPLPDKERLPSGGLLLFVLTLFQTVMCGQICLRFSESLDLSIPASFGLLIFAEWLYFFVTRFFKGFRIITESIVMFLCTLGLAVTACIEPSALIKQVVCVFIGFVGFILLTVILRNSNLTYKLRPVAGAVALVLLFGTVFFGTAYNGSKNWIDLGIVTFQPSEFAKVAYVFAGASPLFLTDLRPIKRLWFFAFSVACMGALALMFDFGAVAIFFVAMIIILLMRLTDVKIVGGITLLAAGGAAVLLIIFPYIAKRFSVWTHVWEFADSTGYQQTRTLIASASGGMFGVGGGNGYLHRVIAADTDLVFGIISEEWGGIIALCLAACFAALGLYAVKLCKHACSPYYSIAVCAAAGIMIFQTALNIFGSTDILPLTGVTIMFVSRGGTSLVAAFLMTAFFKGAEIPPHAVEIKRRRYF